MSRRCCREISNLDRGAKAKATTAVGTTITVTCHNADGGSQKDDLDNVLTGIYAVSRSYHVTMQKHSYIYWRGQAVNTVNTPRYASVLLLACLLFAY